MYAPRPQTHQIPRHYTSNPTGTIHRTSHRNTEKENANALPSKTPSRAAGGGKAVSLAPGTGVRMGLGAKTVGRDRNVLGGGGGGSGVVGGKGKGKEGDEIEPKRLFTTASTSTSSSLQPSKSLSSFPTIIRQSQPTKTPRALKSNTLRTPAPTRTKLVIEEDQAHPIPLPSASKPRRSRSSLSLSQTLTPAKESASGSGPNEGEGGAGGGGGVFKTPAPKWDEGDSLDSITEGLEGMEMGNGGGGGPLHEVAEEMEVEMEEQEQDYEIEYMPPRAIPLPYEPFIACEDPTELMTKVSNLPPLWTPLSDETTEASLPEPKLDLAGIDEIKLCDDADLEDPPLFRRKAVTAKREVLQPKAANSNGKNVSFQSQSGKAGTVNQSLVKGTAPLPTQGKLHPTLGARPVVPTSTSRAPVGRLAPSSLTGRTPSIKPTTSAGKASASAPLRVGSRPTQTAPSTSRTPSRLVGTTAKAPIRGQPSASSIRTVGTVCAVPHTSSRINAAMGQKKERDLPASIEEDYADLPVLDDGIDGQELGVGVEMEFGFD